MEEDIVTLRNSPPRTQADSHAGWLPGGYDPTKSYGNENKLNRRK